MPGGKAAGSAVPLAGLGWGLTCLARQGKGPGPPGRLRQRRKGAKTLPCPRAWSSPGQGPRAGGGASHGLGCSPVCFSTEVNRRQRRPFLPSSSFPGWVAGAGGGSRAELKEMSRADRRTGALSRCWQAVSAGESLETNPSIHTQWIWMHDMYAYSHTTHTDCVYTRSVGVGCIYRPTNHIYTIDMHIYTTYV